MTFQEARNKLMEISGGKFRAMYYQLTEYGDGRTSADCRVYIDGANNPTSFGIPTWQEAIDVHIKAQLPIETKVADTAEMPE